jgi:hypothetical protein
MRPTVTEVVGVFGDIVRFSCAAILHSITFDSKVRFDIDFRFKTVFCAVVLLKKLKNVAYQDFFHWRASWFWRS